MRIDDSQLDLYAMNPDGTDLELLYGAHSHATGTAIRRPAARRSFSSCSRAPMQDGRTLALIRPFTGTDEGGDLVLIDTANYVDNTAARRAANAGIDGSGAGARAADRCAHDSGPVARRPLSLGGAAVRRHQSPARELVAVPARSRTDASCRARAIA